MDTRAVGDLLLRKSPLEPDRPNMCAEGGEKALHGKPTVEQVAAMLGMA